MRACSSSVIVVAAGLAGPGAVLASASPAASPGPQSLKDGSDMRPVVDPITATVYLDHPSRGLGLRSPSSLRGPLPLAVTLGTTGVLACGAACQAAAWAAGLGRQRPGPRAKEPEEVRPSLRSSSSKVPAPDRHEEPVEGPGLHVKVGVAMLVGVAVSCTVRRAARPRPAAARAAKAVAQAEAPRAARGSELVAEGEASDDNSSHEVLRQLKAKEPMFKERELSREDFSEGFGDRAAGLASPGEARWQAYDEPQPELDPGKSEDSADDPLQPGNKGYVKKKKTEYEEKEKAETEPLAPTRMRRGSSSGSRSTEFHRIATEPQDPHDDAEADEYYGQELLSSNDDWTPRSAARRDPGAGARPEGGVRTSFFRISTEG